MDWIRNCVIRREVGGMRDLAGGAESCVLRWFGHIEHMDGERINGSGVEGGRGRGRPHRRWLDGVVLAFEC